MCITANKVVCCLEKWRQGVSVTSTMDSGTSLFRSVWPAPLTLANQRWRTLRLFATGCHHVSKIDSVLSIANQHELSNKSTYLGTPTPSSPWSDNFVILYKTLNNVMIIERGLGKEVVCCVSLVWILSPKYNILPSLYFKETLTLNYLLRLTLMLLGT